MSSRRNEQNLTPAAARALAQMPRFSTAWGVEKRLREQLWDASLVVVERRNGEISLRLTETGKQVRKVYRRVGLHRAARQQAELTREQRDDLLIAANDVSGAAADIVLALI